MLPTDSEPFAQLVRKLDARNRLISVTPLSGGVSAQITLVEFAAVQGERKVVVRKHGAIDLKQNPQIAADEFALLRMLYARGLPVPAPLHVEHASEMFGAPVLVSEYVQGSTQFQPTNLRVYIERSAALLARIHGLADAPQSLPFLPNKSTQMHARFMSSPEALNVSLRDESIAESRIRQALAAHWPIGARNTAVLLHGDFWPGNLLWRDERIVAVIDWEDASIGDPLADLANTRLELLWFFGAQAQRDFTDQYNALRKIDLAALPVWDLCAALKARFNLPKWAADTAMEARMRSALRQFVDEALSALAARR